MHSSKSDFLIIRNRSQLACLRRVFMQVTHRISQKPGVPNPENRQEKVVARTTAQSHPEAAWGGLPRCCRILEAKASTAVATGTAPLLSLGTGGCCYFCYLHQNSFSSVLLLGITSSQFTAWDRFI